MTTAAVRHPEAEVWEAFKKVKVNQGAAGVDGQTIAEFEAGLAGNLYKLWNRLSSGSYFPPPVRRVDIPKADERRHASVGHTNGGRSCRPRGCPPVSGAVPGTRVPRRPIRATGPAAWRSMPPCARRASGVLAVRLGARHRHQGVL